MVKSPKLTKTEQVNSDKIPKIPYLSKLLIQLIYPVALNSLLLQIFCWLIYKSIFNPDTPKIQKFKTKFLIAFPLCTVKSLKQHNKNLLA